jgi:LysR family transcriptional regulator, benzoate and cis,cis-muconate-responsive activator of ben and cat genes
VNLKSLELEGYVLAVAEEGSFSGAARIRHTSPGFVSGKVTEYEKEIGTKVFERSTRSVKLTQAGELVVAAIQTSVRDSERAQEIGRYYGRLSHGPFRIGYSHYSSDVLLQHLHHLNLAKLEARYIRPEGHLKSRIEVENGSTPDLIERVLRGQLHAGLGIHPIHERELWVELVTREPFCLCLPKGHALTFRPSIAVHELHGQTLFLVPRKMHPAFYDRTVEYMQNTGAHPVYQEVDSVAYGIKAAGLGLGMALLPSSMSDLSHPGAVFRQITDELFQVETVLFAKRELMKGVLHDFILYLAEQLQAAKVAAHR